MNKKIDDVSDRKNRRSGILLIMLVVLALAVTAGCGYNFTGVAGTRMISGQSLWVNFINVEKISGHSSAQTIIRRAILDECHAFRGLPPSHSEASADIRVKGNLRSYLLRPVSYNAFDQAREYRLTIEVDLELFNRGDTSPVWKGTLQGYADFPAGTDLSLQRSAEEAALTAASRVIAQRFLTSIEQSY